MFQTLLQRSVLLSLVFFLTSCASRREVNFEAYQRAPSALTSNLTRCIAKACPPLKRLLYYGNYGGLGQKGGEPIDRMDDLFRRHDMVYYLGESLDTLYAGDEALIAGLEGLKPETLDKHGQKYRVRAINYFSSPMARVVGKPWALVLRRDDANREGPLEGDGEVERLFDLDLPGFPPAKPSNARRGPFKLSQD